MKIQNEIKNREDNKMNEERILNDLVGIKSTKPKKDPLRHKSFITKQSRMSGNMMYEQRRFGDRRGIQAKLTSISGISPSIGRIVNGATLQLNKSFMEGNKPAKAPKTQKNQKTFKKKNNKNKKKKWK